MGEKFPLAGFIVFVAALSFVGSSLIWANHVSDHPTGELAHEGSSEPQTFTIGMKDLVFSPIELTIPVGSTVIWENEDPFGHTVTPTDKAAWGTEGSGDHQRDWIEAGESWSFTFDEEGVFDYYCIPHAGKGADGLYQGMVGKIIVSAATVATSDGASMAGAGPAWPTDVDEIGRSAFDVPAPITRTTPAHLTFDITSREVTAEMDDGITYTYWTFDGQVPGPMLRVREGDTVTVNHHNDASSIMTHNIDFHAVTGPGGGAAGTIAAPGETATITFKALNPGLYVYHCAFQDPPLHIAHGMYGMILVEPETPLPPVDHEYYVVQGEFYSPFDAGTKGHHPYDGERAAAENPTFAVFNGRVGSLTGDRALQANVGETVRLYVGVGGPNLVSSFHVIGEIFDHVYNQGSLTSPPLNDVQTTLIPAGGAAVVEFKVEYPGDYFLVDHSIYRVHKGTFGVLHVEGEPDPDVYREGP